MTMHRLGTAFAIAERWVGHAVHLRLQEGGRNGTLPARSTNYTLVRIALIQQRGHSVFGVGG